MNGAATTSPLDTLRGQRSVLLACEAIGWLHMTGKAHPDFLRQHGGQANAYDPKHWVTASGLDWAARLDWWKTSCTTSNLTLPQTRTDFCQSFDAGSSAENLLGLLQAGHAMSSGIEKNLPGAASRYLGQDVTHLWLSTAFGHPVRNLLADPPDVLARGGWDDLITSVGRLLEEMKTLGSSSIADVNMWGSWREGAIGQSGWLRGAFLNTLAETRLPNNDVTLWDQSYVAAALFKAAVAGTILAGPGEWIGLKQKTRWRVLTVGFGAEHYEARAVRIGDWAGSRREIALFFDEVCRLVEVDTAIGSLLYRDDRVLAFTFPGLLDGSETDPKSSLTDSAADGVRTLLEQEIDELARARAFETPPRCCLSSSTRSFISMARQVTSARAAVEIPLHRAWSVPKLEQAGGHVCPVCHVRQSGKANDKQSTCKLCRERRRGRLDAWKDTGGDTIWITEVADNNDRVALLTLHLDLASWLDGSSLDSFRAQSIVEWRQHNPVLGGQNNPIDRTCPLPSLRQHIESFVRQPKTNAQGKLDDRVLASLHDGFRHETSLEEFFRKIVEDRSDAPTWNALDDAQRAEWLTHQLFRKHASPGRIHRLWRTTEQFFFELLSSFREAASREANRWRVRRLVLAPDPGNDWQDKETYRGTWIDAPDAPFEVLYRNESKDFITVCNLARILRREQKVDALNGASIELTGDDGTTRTLTIDKASEATERLGTYSPLIVLEQSPERFRVLVPLSVAQTCIAQALDKWETELGRVWDRLPLRVGVVAFPRKTPYQAVVEAARNIEDALTANPSETWRVVDARARQGVTALSVVRPDGEPELVTAPTRIADGREDAFYPYCQVEDRRCRDAHDFAAPMAKNLIYRRMPALRTGDGIRVMPSRIATVFLDSTARRFDTPSVRPLSDWKRMLEIWRLVQERAPSLTAVRAMAAALADARSRWSEPDGRPGSDWLRETATRSWLDFVRALLSKEWSVSGAALDTLVEAARTGVLQGSLTWHLQVLKLGMENES